MSRSYRKWVDLYFNKFGHEISYNHLMKMVPLAQTEKEDVESQNWAVFLAISFYFANHAETWGWDSQGKLGFFEVITENNLWPLFAG